MTLLAVKCAKSLLSSIGSRRIVNNGGVLNEGPVVNYGVMNVGKPVKNQTNTFTSNGAVTRVTHQNDDEMPIDIVNMHNGCTLF